MAVGGRGDGGLASYGPREVFRCNLSSHYLKFELFSRPTDTISIVTVAVPVAVAIFSKGETQSDLAITETLFSRSVIAGSDRSYVSMIILFLDLPPLPPPLPSPDQLASRVYLFVF